MPRTLLTAVALAGSYPSLPVAAGSADFTFVGGNSANGYEIVHSGRLLVLMQNTAVGAQTCTIVSVPDDKNRTGDITAYSLAAGDFARFGDLKAHGWAQTDGKLYLDASDDGVKFCVLNLSGI